MKRIIYSILLLIVSGYFLVEAPGTERTQESVRSGNTYVLMVSGINKDSEERLAKDRAVTELSRYFLEIAGVKPDRLNVLVDRVSTGRKGSGISTAENLKERIDRLAALVNPEDRFIFYYTGQANVVSDTLRFNLPGPDITHVQLAGWISAIKASSILIVLDCPGAGLAVKAVAGRGRIIIGACTAEQHYSTRFSQYFVPALVDDSSDTNSDGRISLLEAFTFTCRAVDAFYRLQSLLTTETPILEDNGDGIASRQPWLYEQNKMDGLAASRFFFQLNSRK